MKVLLFAGTTEGRVFAEWLLEKGISLAVCVATEYGQSLLPEELEVKVGRLDSAQMATLMNQGYTHVVDATHPYAAVVSANIQKACEEVNLPCFRLLRDGAPEGDWHHVSNITDASELCKTLDGNILLTTGSKELEPFAVEGLLERTYPRVLPTADSLERCLDLNFPIGHILCMQGPFSQKLNEALIEQFEIKNLVTKASGGAGGFWEKVVAAKACNATLIVIERPTDEVGYTIERLQQLEVFCEGRVL